MQVGDKIEITETKGVRTDWWVKGDIYILTMLHGDRFSVRKTDGSEDTNGWNFSKIKYKLVDKSLFPIY